VAELVRAVIAFPAVLVLDTPLLLRALEVYEVDRLDFAEAYLVACAEASGVQTIASFDRSIDGVATVRRVEPS
jgi:predicted nucleic acid-binding protein